MKRFIPVLAALAVLGTACTKEIQENTLVSPQEQTLMTKLVGGSDGDLKPGSVLVKLDRAAVTAIENGKVSEVTESLLGDMKIKSFKSAIPARPKNIEVAKKYGLDQWFNVEFDEGVKHQVVAAKLAASPAVRSIQYNRYVRPVDNGKVYPIEDEVIVTRSAADGEEAPMNDPYLKHQWNLINDGTIAEAAVAGADVGVKDAWRLTGGDPSVIVAVLDCGLHYRHEDLEDAIWKNEAEINGEPDVDDDENGFIDDKYGFNFVNCFDIEDDFISNRPAAIKGKAINYITQTGHGTHVAGIIGATNGNGKGISSIAGGTGNGDGVRLMSCQTFDYDSKFGLQSTSDAQVAAAYIYAADNGACIAQCSYGNSNEIKYDDIYINGDGKDVDGAPLEYAAIKYFLDPKNSNHESLEGNIIVFSAGNFGKPQSMYPGALPEVLSVTAFGYDFLPGGYTHYGPGCKIAAPGGEMRQAKDHNESMILSIGVTGIPTASELAIPGLVKDDGKKTRHYVYMHGTSMACPHVSGVLALGISYAKKLGKKFTREELTSLLLTSVNDIDQYLQSGTKSYYDSFTGNMVSNIPLNQYYGKMGTGAVDAWKFLMAIEGTPSVIVKAGAKSAIDLSDYCSPSGSYKISVDDATKTSLGLSSDPVIKNGKLEIECSKVGAGKIVLSSSVGKDTATEGGIGSMDYSREISIVSREFATNNGGWL